MQKPDMPFRVLCVMTHHVLDALPQDAPVSDVIDELKWMVAQSGLNYPPPDQFAAVADAVQLARAKGYRTPKGSTKPSMVESVKES